MEFTDYAGKIQKKAGWYVKRVGRYEVTGYVGKGRVLG